MSRHELPPDFHIQPMTMDDLYHVVEWTKQLHWNFSRSDLERFFAIDPGGFFVGKINNQIVSSISALIYNKYYAFVGFFITDPSYRGRGFGKAVWDHAIQRLDDNNVQLSGIDTVIEQIPRFQAAGYKQAYPNARYIFQSPSTKQAPLTAPSIHTAAFDPSDLEEICLFDEQFEIEVRPGFTQSWLQTPQSLGLIWRQSPHAPIQGYIFTRKVENGYVICPLYAHSPTIASDLLLSLLQNLPANQSIYANIPEVNIDAIQLFESVGFTHRISFMRMYRNHPQNTKPISIMLTPPLHQIYAIKSVAVG